MSECVTKRGRARVELAAQLAVVVDLAVEDDREPVVGDDRLIAAGKVQDREPSRDEGGAVAAGGVALRARLAPVPAEKPPVVRAAVREAPAEQGERRGIDVATRRGEDAGDAAHLSGLPLRHARAPRRPARRGRAPQG